MKPPTLGVGQLYDLFRIHHTLNCVLLNKTKENFPRELSLSVIDKYYSTQAQSDRKRFCDAGVEFIHSVCCQFRWRNKAEQKCGLLGREYL